MELNKTTKALLYFMKSALQEIIPEMIPELDYEALYKLSAAHSVVSMVAMALESANLLTEEYATAETINKWKTAKANAIRKNVLLDTEREVLLSYLEKEGAWYVPLKGAVLKDMYPKMGMRQMADNDIWFDETYRHSVKLFMEKRGYQVISFNRDKHDVYEKAPVYNYEFHVTLFSNLSHPEWIPFCESLKNRLVKDEDKEFSYHFTDEDFYVYFMLHSFAHYSNSGTGIRLLSDVFVYLQKKAQTMDWDYIIAELKNLNISEFEMGIRKLSEKLFEEDLPLEDEEKELLFKLLGSGTYGTLENYIENKLTKMQNTGKKITLRTKFKYVWQRIFPDYEFMKQYSPFCEKHPWSVPFLWVYRWVRALAGRRKAIWREIYAIRKK